MELKVWTSRYFNPNVITCGLVPVGITLYKPRFGLKYQLSANVLDLAPDRSMIGVYKTRGHDAFAVEYVKKLDKLGAPAIRRALEELQADAPGVVLLCYEDLTKGEETCHRRVLAEWLKTNADLVVDELPDPGRKTPKRGRRWTGATKVQTSAPSSSGPPAPRAKGPGRPPGTAK